MTLVCSLAGNDVGKDGAEALAKALETNSSLQTLKYAAPHLESYCQPASAAADACVCAPIRSLEYNKIGAIGAKALGKALETNSTLQTLKYAASRAVPYCQEPASAPADTSV